MNLLSVRLKLAPLLLASAVATATHGQSSKPAAPAVNPEAYAAEPLVVVRLDTVSEMQADGTGSAERTGVVRVQSDAMLKQFSVLSLPLAGNSGKVEFRYARVRHADGTLTETPPSDMLEEPAPITREAPFYSDLKTAELPIRGLRVGDTLEWQTRYTLLKAAAPGQFWGQDSFISEGIALEESYELHAPAAMHLTSWTNPESTAVFSRSVSGSTQILRWTHQNLKPTVGTSADAARDAEKKKILSANELLDADQGKLADFAWTTFSDWGAVGAWYRGLEADRMQPDPVIKAKVADITAGKTSQEEKVRAVYAYVSTQIHYIGVAFGIGRYQPHTAVEVLNSQYGDCKDKHTLLASMLLTLGLQPDAVLIGSGVRFNEAVPSPDSFNHLITLVNLDGKPVWLDSTAEVAPYRLLSAPLRDKQALVVPAQGPAAVERTPADVPFPFVDTMTAKGSLDKDGISTSRITLTYRGDTELFLRAVTRQVTPAQYDDLTQRLVASMGYSGTTSHSEFSRPDDTTQPFTISFDYRREKGGDWDNHRIVSQLAPVQLPVIDPKDPPRQPLNLLQPRTEVSHAEMQLPPGWSAELPEAIHEKSPYATYDLTYHLDKGLLIADRRVVVLAQKVPLTDLPRYKTWQEAVNLGNDFFVQLDTASTGSKPGNIAHADAGKTDGATPKLSPAAELVQKANDELRDHQLPAAQLDLDRARSLDSGTRGLWAGYGFLDFSRGEQDAAIRDYKKELALHPGNTWTEQHLFALQLATHQNADAEQTLRTWITSEPGNPAPVSALAGLLVEEAKPKDAVAVIQANLGAIDPATPNLDMLKIQLGRAQIKAGLPADATATLKPLLESSSANTLNDAAYELADARLELAADEAAERKALAKLELETSSWTLHEVPLTLAQASSLLAASWDTMGWILFREGKPSDALPFLEAARQTQTSWIVSEHLGEAKEALHDQRGALAAFEEADALVPRHDAMGIHQEPTPEVKALEANIAHLKQGTTAATLINPASQQGRTFPLGSAKGRSVTAEYRLLISRNKVEGFEPMSEKEVPDTAALLSSFKTAAFFPPDSDARLVKTAFVNCHSSVCELLLEK